MSEALERVIAEQQAKIDDLQSLNNSYCKQLESIYIRHDALFENIARLIDERPFSATTEDAKKRYHELATAARLGLMDAGYCLRCYNFVCECDPDD